MNPIAQFREACAKVAEDYRGHPSAGTLIAAAIRKLAEEGT